MDKLEAARGGLTPMRFAGRQDFSTPTSVENDGLGVVRVRNDGLGCDDGRNDGPGDRGLIQSKTARSKAIRPHKNLLGPSENKPHSRIPSQKRQHKKKSE
jgi:hypothetical protein